MDRTNANTALASALCEELARCGMRHAVIAPGSRSSPLAVALHREQGISTRITIDERCAGFTALGAAQATGRPVAVLCTSGTASANLHPAIIEADEGAVPLLALTADRPPELRGIGAGQTIDQLKLYGSAVRWFCEVGTHEPDDDGLLHFRATACRAYAAARGDPRPGPVHLNVPWREPLAPVEVEGAVTAGSTLALEGRGERPLAAVEAPIAAPSEDLLEQLAGLLCSAHPVILAGRQPDPGLAPLLADLAIASGAPLLAEPTSQARLGHHDRSLVISAYDAIARARPEALAPSAVLRFGDMPTSKPLRQWLAGIEGLQQAVVDPAWTWNEPSRRAALIARADPTLVATGLAALLEGGASDFGSRWAEADGAARATIDRELAAESSISEPAVQLALGEAVADGDLVLAASSMPIRDQEAFMPPAEAEVRFLANRGANGIDGLVSTAAGAAWAAARRTWAVIGDLALVHDLGGLASLDPELPLRLIVIDNAGGGIFHFLPAAEALEPNEFEQLLATPSGIDVPAVAAAHGISSATATTRRELDRALAGAARLVHVPTDRRANVEVHRRIAAAVAAVLGGA